MTNEYRAEWEFHSNHIFVTPHVTYNEDDNSVSFGVEYESSSELYTAMKNTGRAIGIGLALAKIDGPLPVGDVVGLAVASAMAVRAWYNFFTDD